MSKGNKKKEKKRYRREKRKREKTRPENYSIILGRVRTIHDDMLRLVNGIVLYYRYVNHLSYKPAIVSKEFIEEIKNLTIKFNVTYKDDKYISNLLKKIPKIRMFRLVYLILGFILAILFSVLLSGLIHVITVKYIGITIEKEITLLIGTITAIIYAIAIRIFIKKRERNVYILYQILNKLLFIIRVDYLNETTNEVLEGNPQLVEAYEELSKDGVIPKTDKLPSYKEFFKTPVQRSRK